MSRGLARWRELRALAWGADLLAALCCAAFAAFAIFALAPLAVRLAQGG